MENGKRKMVNEIKSYPLLTICHFPFTIFHVALRRYAILPTVFTSSPSVVS